MLVELEDILSGAEKNLEGVKTNSTDFTIEMFKAAGLAAGISKEASLIVGDITYLIQGAQYENTLLSNIAGLNKNIKSNGN